MRSAWFVVVLGMVASAAACTPWSDEPTGPDPAVCGSASHEAPPPPADCPPGVEFCGIGDLDMRAWCRDSQVFSEAPVYFDYCFCGTSENACRLVRGQNPPPQYTCPGDCVDELPHYFDSYQEFNDFDPSTLCAVPDAGLPDAPGLDAAP
jgi:hypothetical protein